MQHNTCYSSRECWKSAAMAFSLLDMIDDVYSTERPSISVIIIFLFIVSFCVWSNYLNISR